MKTLLSFSLVFFCISRSIYAQEEPAAVKKAGNELFALTIDDIAYQEIESASKNSEKLNEAPATTIVITAEDIRLRGYTSLFDVFNDLPSFDLSRAYGDDEYYIHTRGNLVSLSGQMLFMIDGKIMNYLYNNRMQAYLMYPLYNIERIEIVYGPASVVYGANAFMGVVHIITKKEGKSNVFLSKGSYQNHLIELNLNEINEKGNGLSVHARFLRGNAPSDIVDRTPTLRSSILTDPQQWGPFRNTEFFGYRSPINSNYLQATFQQGNFQFGFMGFFHESGYGSEFAFDRSQPNARWQFDEETFFINYKRTINRLKSNTLVHFRQSGVPGTSFFVGRWDANTKYASYWATSNLSLTLFQDFSLDAGESFKLNFGVKFQSRYLQKAYETVDGPPVSNDSTAYPLNILQPPIRGIFALDQDNHYSLNDQGAYVQGKYYLQEGKLIMIGGVRYDYNDIWKDIFTPRVGVIWNPSPRWSLKTFYGTAFLEPAPRVLYGGWEGSLSNPNIKPERMQTVEASIAHINQFFTVGLSSYWNQGSNLISIQSSTPVNVGKNQTIGADLYFRFAKKIYGEWVNHLKLDAYVSYTKAEMALDGTNMETTGNIAPFKVRFIPTALLFNKVSVSVPTRFVSETPTVNTNPISSIGAYVVSDLSLIYNDFLAEGLSLGIKVYNLNDADYYHAGYRDASAGEAPDGISQGWYNSRLPQARRHGYVTLRMEF